MLIVAVAFLTTMAMPPMLRWSLSRIPLREEEQRRLEREERDAKGFVSSLERILVVSDESPNARFSGEVAGLIAGPRQTLTTVLSIGSAGSPGGAAHPAAATVAETIEQTASRVARDFSGEEGNAGRPMEVIAMTAAQGPEDLTSQAVKEELRKGYDLLMIGLAPPADDRTLSKEAADVILTCDGPSVIAHARGRHATGASARNFRILLPVRATPYSYRASEFAVELARATGSTVDAI